MTSPHVLRLQASEDTTTKSWRFKSGLLHCFSPFVTFVRQCGNSRDQCGRTAAHRPTHFCKNAGPTILPEANLVLENNEGVASCGEESWVVCALREAQQKKMVVGLVPPFDHCAETDFVQRIASPGDSTRKSIHDHADKKTNRRERNTIRTNIAGQRTTSSRDQVGKPKRPLQRRPRWPRGAQGVLSTRAANGWRGYPQGTVRKLTGTRPRPRCVPTKLCVTPNAK